MHREKYLNGLCTGSLKDRPPEFPSSGVPGLLILDMQDYFLSPESHAFVPSAPELLPRLVALAELFEARELPVILTRHLNNESDAGNMGTWWRGILTEENPLSRINAALDRSWPAVISKSRYDAFCNTHLNELLREMEVSSVIVTGVMTHLCCESTARTAFNLDYRVIFPVDGTATYNRELHRATTLNLSHGFAKPVSLNSIMKTLAADD